MRMASLVIIMLVAQPAYAYTGICFLDAILHALDGLKATIDGIVSPTTTTSTTTSTSTTSTTSSTTISTSTTSSTSTTTSQTTTTTFPGECRTVEDCPPSREEYKCNFAGNIDRQTTVFFCADAGLPNSMCKSRQKLTLFRICQQNEQCVTGLDYCVKN